MTWEAVAMRSFVKKADLLDPAASPIPSMQLTPAPAPGKKGPAGMSPRQNTSRVNTGVPPVADAGASAQKMAPPDGAHMLPTKVAQLRSEDHMATTAGRPSVHDMIKSAMIGTAERVAVASEAARQMKLAEGSCEKCNKTPCACEKAKTASIGASTDTSTDHLDKLASALEFVAVELEKGASIQISAGTASGTEPGHGPGALTVMQAGGKSAISDNVGQAKASLVPPTSTGLQRGDKAATTQMQNDAARAPGGPGKQQSALPGQKGKTASVPIALIRKHAEDAINPARISAGPSSPPDTREGGQPGGVPPVGNQTSMISSNDAATNYTKGQAKAEAKADMGSYITEPAHSAAHDHVLQNAFSHTGAAGVKISSATEKTAAVRTAAARAFLTNLVEMVQPKAG